MNAHDLLKFFYPEGSPGYLAICGKWKNGRFETKWFPTNKLTEAAAQTAAWAKEANTYYSVALFNEEAAEILDGKGRTIPRVMALPGLWLDIDLKDGSDAHSKKNLPATVEEALRLFTPIDAYWSNSRLVGDFPSIIVHSGHGLHVYWLFQELWLLDSPEKHARAVALADALRNRIRQRASEHGWHIDNVSDLAHILRLPGTLNHKCEPAVEVKVMEDIRHPRRHRYTPDELEVLFASDEKPAARKSRRNDTGDFHPADLSPIVDGCGFAKHCRDDAATLSEEEWYALQGILGFVENGDQIVHEWSKPYTGYSAAETSKKLEQWRKKATGPVTCQHIRDKAGGESFCKNCPQWGDRKVPKITSPVRLGMSSPVIRELVEQVVWITGVEQFYHKTKFVMLTQRQLTAHNAHLVKKAAEKLLANKLLPKVDNPTYAPGGEQFPVEDGQQKVNLYRPGDLKPEAGNTAPWDEHLALLIRDDEVRNAIQDFLAFLVQRPGEKVHWAPLLHGPQGSGKSLLFATMRLILGQHNTTEIGESDINNQFNGYLKDKQLIAIEEVYMRGRLELMNRLKTIITSPVVRINDKNTKVYEQPNRVNLILFTNHEEALQLEETDRRFLIYSSTMQPQPQEYYRQYFGWLGDGGASAIYHALLARDLRDFNPKGHAPMTDDKRAMIAAGRSPLEAWFRGKFEANEWPLNCDLVVAERLLAVLPSNLQVKHVNAIYKVLRAIGAVQLGQQRLGDNTRPSLWAVRRADFWQKQGQGDIAAHYDKHGLRARGYAPGTEDRGDTIPF